MDIRKVNEASKKKLIMRKHAYHRMRERGISYLDVKEAIRNGGIIESYPNDFPYPSCLILGKIDNDPIHIVCAIVEKGLLIITVYVPDKDEWDKSFRKRLMKT